MIKSGADICNEITSYEAIHEPSLNTKEYSDLVGEGYYLFSDVDLRIKFYTQYAGNPGQLLKDYVGLEDVYLKKHQMYSDWLFVFCFGDMNEDFKAKIEKLEEKKI